MKSSRRSSREGEGGVGGGGGVGSLGGIIPYFRRASLLERIDLISGFL